MKKFLLFILVFLSIISSAYSLTNINSCAATYDANTPGETYRLTADLVTTTNCITITADNVNLDCNGHTISSNGAGTGISISGTILNSDVYNCNIEDFNIGLVIATHSDFNTISNVNISGSTGSGLIITSWSDDNILTNINSSNNGDKGIEVKTLSYRESFTNIVTNNNTNYGVYFDTSTRSTIDGFTAINNPIGLHVRDPSVNDVDENNITNFYLDNDFDIEFSGNVNNLIFTNGTSNSYIYVTGTNYFIDFNQSKKNIENPNRAITLIDNSSSFFLTQDFTTTSSGIVFLSNDYISLDCQGNSIIGPNVISTAGISFRELEYVSVKNCNIRNFDNGISITSNARYNNFTSINISNSIKSGVSLSYWSHYNNLKNIESSNNGEYGIRITHASTQDYLEQITTNNNSIAGVYFKDSYKSSIDNFTAINNSKGLIIEDAPVYDPNDNNNITNFYFSNNTLDIDLIGGTDNAIFALGRIEDSSKVNNIAASNKFYMTIDGKYLGNYWTDNSACSNLLNFELVQYNGLTYKVCNALPYYSVGPGEDRGVILGVYNLSGSNSPFYTEPTPSNNAKISSNSISIKVDYNGGLVADCQLNLDNGSTYDMTENLNDCEYSFLGLSNSQLINYNVSYSNTTDTFYLENRQFTYYPPKTSQVFPSIGIGSLIFSVMIFIVVLFI